MMKLFLSLCLLANVAGAQDFSPTSIIDRAVTTYNKASTMSVEFDQTIYNSLTGNRSTARGKLIRQKPGKLSITFTDPANDKIIADGKNLWIYLPSSAPGQVIKMSGGDVGSFDPASQFVSNPKSRYKIENAGTASISGRETHALLLTPKNANGTFTKAKIWVDDVDNNIRKFELTENSGLVRTVTSRSIATNTAIRGTTFQFTVPKGVRVVTR